MKKDKQIYVNSNVLDVMNITFDKTLKLASENSGFGEPIVKDGVTLIPISKISAGFAGGGADIADGSKKKAKSPAGAGAKVELSPVVPHIIIASTPETIWRSIREVSAK